MKWMKLFLVLSFLVLVSNVSRVLADNDLSLSIYVNGTRFSSPYVVQSNEIFVQKAALIGALRVSPDVLSTAKEVEQNNDAFVSLSDVASILHGQLSINWQTGIVDLTTTMGTSSGYAAQPGGSATVVAPQSSCETSQPVTPVSCLPLNPPYPSSVWYTPPAPYSGPSFYLGFYSGYSPYPFYSPYPYYYYPYYPSYPVFVDPPAPVGPGSSTPPPPERTYTPPSSSPPPMSPPSRPMGPPRLPPPVQRFSSAPEPMHVPSRPSKGTER